VKRLPIVAAGIAGVLALGLISSVISQGFQEIAEVEAERHRLRAEKARLEEGIDLLEATLEALRTDPRAVESLARRDLGWVRPGERVLLISTPTPVPRPVALTDPEATPILSLRD